MLPEKLMHGKEYHLGYGVQGHFDADRKAFFISEGPGLQHEGFWLKMSLTVFINYEKEGRIMDKIDIAFENTKRILKDDKADIIGRLEAEKRALDSTFSGLDLPEEKKYINVRLRIQNPSQGHIITWALKFGDSCFDQDHRGFWASGCVSKRVDNEDLFHDLEAQVLDHIGQVTSENYDL